MITEEDTMRDVRRLVRATVHKARGMAVESDGKALGDPARRARGRRQREEAGRRPRRRRPDETPGR
ncbi:hypothetical protein [Streptomyces sp. NPDC049916]|uniref:hypothetical protein n=1 Tax=Streptomyces sp. NPDC049916 TaxID=3155156 RepID=UPI00342EC85D